MFCEPTLVHDVRIMFVYAQSRLKGGSGQNWPTYKKAGQLVAARLEDKSSVSSYFPAQK